MTKQEFQEACKLLVPEALAALQEVIQNGANDRSRLQAIETVLSRAYGKPGVTKDEGTVNEFEAMTTKDRVQALQIALAEEQKKLSSEMGLPFQ